MTVETLRICPLAIPMALLLSNPMVVAGTVTTAIGLPVAIHNYQRDRDLGS